MSDIDLLLLGSPRIERGGRPAAVETRKALALLAYLAVEEQATRDTLAALLWPESDETRAKGSLRRTLFGIRDALGEGALMTDRRSVSLSGREVDVDLHRFRSALVRARGHGHDDNDVCSRCLPHLEAALSLYRGEFLEGFSIADAPGFEDWARTVTESLRLDCARAAERLAAGHAATGDYPAAVAATQKWIDLDFLHEPAHRYLMLLRGWEGDRSGAIEAYRRCTAVLDAELGVAPLEETTELYEAILDDDLPPAPSMRRRVKARVDASPSAPSSMIDREEELAHLEGALAVSDRGGRLIAIRGETWMGKSRLLDEFITAASSQNHRAVTARGFEAERSLPFGIVAQLLHSGVAADATADVLRSAPAWALAEASRLVPDLAASDAQQPPAQPQPTSDVVGETRLFEGLCSVLARIGAGTPGIVAIDDAQWMDTASWSFVSYLARRLPEMPLLLLIAHRPAGTLAESPVRDLVLSTLGATTLTLGPLHSEDLEAAVPDPGAAADIVERTGGVPLLVSEHVANSGVDLTPGVRQFMQAQLASVDALAAQVLAAAAVLDGTCDVDLLRATSGRGEDEVVDAVEALVATGILEEVPGTVRLRFALDSVERLVYDETSPVRKRLLHRRAATALADRDGTSADARTATAIALHHRAGGSDEDAAHWYARAGDLSREVFAHAEAEAAYLEALALGHPEPEGLRLALGELRMLAGRYREALDEFQAAAARASAEVRATAEHWIGETQRRLGRFYLAQHHFELAETDHPNPALLYADWALLWLRRGDRSQAATAAAQSRAAAEEGGDDAALARAHNIIGIVTDAPNEALAHLEQAVELAGSEPAARMTALNSLAFHLAGRDDIDRATALLEEALELALLVGDRHREAALRNHLADLLHRAGRDEESREALTEAVRIFADLEPGSWEPEVWLLTRW